MLKAPLWSKIIFFSIISSIFLSLLNFTSFYFLGTIIQVSYEKDYEKLILWMILVLSFFVINMIMNLAFKLIFSKIIPDYKHRNRRHILKSWFCFFSKKEIKKGDINNALFNDSEKIIESKINGLSSIFSGVTDMILLIIFLFLIHWSIGITGISIIIFLILVPYLLENKLNKWSIAYSNLNKNYYGESKELYANKEQYLYNKNLDNFVINMKTKFDKFKVNKLKIDFKNNGISQIMFGINYISYFIPLVVGAFLLSGNYIDIRSITMIVFLSGTILSSTSSITSGIITKNSIKELENKYKCNIIPKKIQRIRLEDFNVERNKKMIFNKNKKISLNKNKNYLFVGPNGSGKTTLINTIVKTNINYKGKMFFNDMNTNKNNINNFFINKPLAKNHYFNSITDIEKTFDTKNNYIFRKLKLYLPKKLINGRCGSKFSQGETQLLSFFHFLATEPNIIIIDESLSAVSYDLKTSIYYEILKSKNIFILIDHSLDKNIKEVFDEIISF